MKFDVSLVITANYQRLVYRIVETQENAATMALVGNDLEKQYALEALLEDYKPPYRDKGLMERHYLIATPFRYPPLKHGSRFGKRSERSYFYASESEETCLLEAAYYRFLFVHGKKTSFSNPIITQYDTFSVEVTSDRIADLTLIKDQNTQEKLTHPSDYQFSQFVGSSCRSQCVDLIRYRSARHEGGINTAIDNADCIISEQPLDRAPVTMEIKQDNSNIVIKRERAVPVHCHISAFYHEGSFANIV